MTDLMYTAVPHSLDYPDAGFDAVLAGAARAYPDRIALRDGELTLTFAELYDRALRFAQGLRDRGVHRGDLVALHMPNSIWFPVSYFGVLCAGAIACPVNPAQPAGALKEQLEEFGVTAVVTHPSCANALDDGPTSRIALVVLVPPTTASPAPEGSSIRQAHVQLVNILNSERLNELPVDPATVAHLQLTGGTTGRSKGVRILHRNLVANIVQNGYRRSGVRCHLDAHGGIQAEKVPQAQTKYSEGLGEGLFLLVSPYFHGAGLVGQCGQILLGITAVIEGRFDAGRYLADIEKYSATRLMGTPAFFHMLLDAPSVDSVDLSSIRTITCGAAPVDETMLGRLTAAFPNAELIQTYGLSEATATVTIQPPAEVAVSPVGSAGVPLSDTQIELRDEYGVSLMPAGEAGEIWVRGPQVSDGYHNDPALTAEQIRDGWLRTGDLGRFDEQGNLFIVGRVKDMIIYKGYNVYPAHLEGVLSEHPEVSQSSVIGLARTDVGELPVAFVVPREPKDAGDDLAERIMAYVANTVAPYQRIREVHFLDQLPITPTGKILKRDLRDML